MTEWKTTHCIYRLHLKVSLPRSKRLFYQTGVCAAYCVRVRWLQKNFVFLISRNFQEIFNFVFSWNFAKIQNNFVKILCSPKFVQSCFAANLCRSGGGGGEWACAYRLAHPLRWRRLCLYRLPFILFSILSSLILWFYYILQISRRTT